MCLNSSNRLVKQQSHGFNSQGLHEFEKQQQKTTGMQYKSFWKKHLPKCMNENEINNTPREEKKTCYSGHL